MLKEIDWLKPKILPTPEEYTALKSLYVEGLIESGAVMVRAVDEEPFRLRSGGTSFLYADHAKIGANRDYFTSLVGSVHGVVGEHVTGNYVICNVDSKLSPQMCGAYAFGFGVDQIIFKDQKLVDIEKGSMQQLTGVGKQIVLLDDVGTSGRTIKEVYDVVQATDLEFDNACAAVGLVREPDVFKENLEKVGIEAMWVVTLDEVLRANLGSFTDKQREAIMQERKIS